MTLAEAAAQADALAEEGKERELADLRRKWEDELEADARSADYRRRAVAYRAVGQFRKVLTDAVLRVVVERGIDASIGVRAPSPANNLHVLLRHRPLSIPAKEEACPLHS